MKAAATEGIFARSLDWVGANLISKLKFRAYLRIEGWLTPSEAYGLYKTAATLKANAVILEIGSWKGKSTYCLAKGLKKGTIYCIDPFNADGEVGSKEIYEKEKGTATLLEQFKANLSGVSSSVTIRTLVGYSHAFIDKIEAIDLLFIDGDHSIDGCRFDFAHFSKAIKIGGFVAFHDYDGSRKELGPTWVVENLLETDPNYCFYQKFDTLMIFRKRGS